MSAEPRPFAPPKADGDAYDVTVCEWFDAQARRTPEAAALVCDSTSLTYRELQAWSRGLSSRLRGRGVGADADANEIVGVCLDKSPAAACGNLGVLGAGGILPIERRGPIASSSRSCVKRPARGS